MATTPTVQRIRLALENAIVDGDYAPGDKLDPGRIAEQYGCSRTPVREALQALEASGLLTVQPKRGTFVAQLGVPELMQRFEVMAELEAFCARLACRRASGEDLQRLAEAQDACTAAAEAMDAERYYAENTLFHQAIYRAAHNEFLEAEALRLQAVLQPYRRRQLRAHGRIRSSLSEHSDILEAIKRGEPALATKLMQDHVLIQGEGFRDMLAAIGPVA
ncbi:GntR family transcriptional regulator [Paracoccus sp. SCSIO 75233]|uniref:GntR family transcriptional regulator n=1 Tax=Paracoccus sp. SCSIO 75233 TaxID=3017782 RepID=UPI0022F0E247|nr:GntR family transcriptional regulator [Paracoccus sp. SCSIO 75233]WBU52041.1 GntR family transcriptional regulator [Paracoccus sp. SCSIO 75233]